MSGQLFELHQSGRVKINTTLRVPPFKRGIGGFLQLFVWTFLINLSPPLNAQYASVGEFQLAAPIIRASNTFFETSTSVSLDLDIYGVVLRYTMNGEAVTGKSPIYSDPVSLSNSAIIKARAFHKDYRASEEVRVCVFKAAQANQLSAAYEPAPADQYTGKGVTSLSDFKKGSMNFRDGHWLGFSADTITFELNSKAQIRQLHLSVLEDHGSWIFAPNKIEVWHGTNQIGRWEASTSDALLPKSFRFIEVPLESSAGLIRVKVILDKIPDWHDGKGTTPWLFIDEIFTSN